MYNSHITIIFLSQHAIVHYFISIYLMNRNIMPILVLLMSMFDGKSECVGDHSAKFLVSKLVSKLSIQSAIYKMLLVLATICCVFSVYVLVCVCTALSGNLYCDLPILYQLSLQNLRTAVTSCNATHTIFRPSVLEI